MNKDDSKERVKRYRERQKTVTQNKALHEKPLHNGTVTLYRYIDGKRVELTEIPEGFKALSDGQVWKPLNPQPVVVKPVEGTTTEKAAKLLLICESLNKFNVAHMVRYGVSGPTMDVVSETLGAS